MLIALHKKWSFPLRISSVNMTKSTGNCGLVTFTEEILNGKLHFLCSVGSSTPLTYRELDPWSVIDFLSNSSISTPAIYLFLQIVFAWSTRRCFDARKIPLLSYTQHTVSMTSNLWVTWYVALHEYLILLAWPFLSFDNVDTIGMMRTNVLLSRRLATRGQLLCKSGPNYIASFYVVCRRNSLTNWGLGFVCHTPVFLLRHHLLKDCKKARLKKFLLLIRSLGWVWGVLTPVPLLRHFL